MGLCGGNWSSAIRWERRDGQNVDGQDEIAANYVLEGFVHICPPPADTSVRVTYLDDNSLVNGTCNDIGDTAQGARFKLTYDRKPDEDTTYHYVGYGRVLNNGAGPAIICGRVTVTAEGMSTDGDTAQWDAVRIGGHGGPGTGEPPIIHPSDSTGGSGGTG